MKHVKIEILIPGMVTAEDVIKGNQLILPRGLVLTDKAIKRLETYEIKSIRIEDPVHMEVEEVEDETDSSESSQSLEKVAAKPSSSQKVEIDSTLLNNNSADDLLATLAALGNMNDDEPAPEPKVVENIEIKDFSEPSHHEKVQQSKEFKEFKKNFESTVSDFQMQVNDIVERNAPIQMDSILMPTMNLLTMQNNTFGVFDMLHNMRQYDDLTYAHSMNVALICNVFAKWLSLSEEEAKLATACGMLHDIGKLKIDDAIIKKPGKLTDEEYKIIKSHPVEGYKILQHQNINEHIKNAALMHHEKCDGTGYPLKLTAEKIDGYAKMVAIADVYDAMTSARVYRGALCPFTVIEMFEKEGLHKYDTLFIMTFLENVINTYIDNRVLLSDGRTGTIKWIDRNNLSKPMVQLADQSFVELSKYADLKIVQIL